MSLPGKPNYRKSFRGKPRPRPDFFTITEGALERLNKIAQQITHPGGSIVFKEGDPAERIFLLCAGQVKLFATSSDRRTIILKIARLGDVLGLSAMLNGLPYEVTAETLGPCHFKQIDQHRFLSFLESHVEIASMAALMLAKEHRELVLGVRRLALLPSAAARIAHILVDFASSGGTTKLSSRFPMILTHAELASLASASRETVTRVLNQFERDGIISRADSTIVILKSAQLKQLAN